MTEEKLYCIYIHTSPIGKSYIGQTCNLIKRNIKHRSKENKCRAFKNAIDKYGWDNFIHEILVGNLTIEEANKLEPYYILFYESLSPNGYNLHTGGNNSTPSDETLKIMSEIMSGENHWNYGGHHSKETCKKLSNAKIGDKNPMYDKLGLDAGHYGKPHSEETKLGMTGENNLRSKIYIITFPDGHEEIIIGMRSFCKIHNLNQSSMSRVARNVDGRTQHKGYKCRYTD